LNKKRELSFHEVLLGLAAMEPCTPHGSTPAEMRCHYIFRYYDVNSDNHLQFTEFKQMIHDIRLSKDQPIDEAALEEEAVKSAKYSWFLYIPSDFYFVRFSEYLEMSVRIV
jgi:hypothetical protein